LQDIQKKELYESLLNIHDLLKTNQLITFELLKIRMNSLLESNIHRIAEERLIKARYGELEYKEQLCIFISVCLVALKEYNGSFWDRIASYYTKLYNDDRESAQLIDGRIRKLIKRFIPKDYVSARHINWLLTQAIVPEYYINDYFNILSVVFVHDFRYELPDDDRILEGMLKSIFKQIARRTTQEDDEIKSKIMNQSYRFIQTTKEIVMSSKYRNTLATYSRMSIKSIAKCINSDLKSITTQPYFDYWADRWFEEQGKIRIDNLLKTSKRIETKFKWRIDFSYEDNRLYLNTKTIFLSSEIDYRDISIEIFSSGNLVYRNDEPIIIENELTNELCSLSIPVNFDPFEVVVRVNGVEMEDETLINDFYMFNLETGKHVSSNIDKYDYLYVISKSLESNNIQKVEENEFYQVGLLNTRTMPNFKYNNKYYTIASIQETYVSGKCDLQSYYLFKNHKISIYNGEILINFHLSKLMAELRLKVNHTSTKILNDVGNNTLLVPQNLLRVGLNEISIVNSKNNKVIGKPCVIYFDQSFRYELENNNLIVYMANEELIVNEIREKDPVTIKMDEEINLIINPMIPRYLDKNQIFKPIDDFLWSDNFSFYDKTVIKGIDADELWILDENGLKFGTAIKYSYDVSYGVHFVFVLTSLKSSHLNYNFIFYKDGKMVFMCPFLNKPIVSDSAIKLENKSDRIEYQVNNVLGYGTFELNVEINGILVDSVEIVEFPLNYNVEKRKAHCYKFSIREHNQIINEKTLLIYEPEYFVHKELKITTVAYLQYHKEQKIQRLLYDELRNFFIKITDHLEDNIFAGIIYTKNQYGKLFYFETINKVEINLDFPILNRNDITATITTFDDGEALFFDMFRHRILDTDEEPKASILSTIDEYALEIEEI
jgi:hypothetical protein